MSADVKPTAGVTTPPPALPEAKETAPETVKSESNISSGSFRSRWPKTTTTWPNESRGPIAKIILWAASVFTTPVLFMFECLYNTVTWNWGSKTDEPAPAAKPDDAAPANKTDEAAPAPKTDDAAPANKTDDAV
ncbi:MAG: hypothetical protein KR126chlam6_01191, partial [Candidatus Anoxychlamydiales bacterium]|nr:hypothetical protein [Candidatus Anoxychlamydiales bacterium]